MATRNNNKAVPVWVGAGDKKVVVNRRDGKLWDAPVFVNAPNGFREFIVALLGKSGSGNLNTIAWEMPESMLKTSVIKDGENAGKQCFVVTIPTEAAEHDALCELLAANVRPKGFVDPARQSVYDRILAKQAAAQPEMKTISDIAGFGDS